MTSPEVVAPPDADVAEGAPPQQGAPPRAGAGRLALLGLRRYSLVVLVLVCMAGYSVWGRTSAVFLTAANFQNIFASQAVLVAITVGLILPMVAGSIDLSVGSIAGLSSIAAAAFLANANLPLPAALILAIAVGALAGAVNGALTVGLHIDSFIITLGTAGIMAAIVQLYTNGLSIVVGIPNSLLVFGRTNFLGIPKVVWLAAVVAVAVYYMLEHTPFGRSLRAIGSNREAARLLGIPVERRLFAAFVLAGAFSGVGGVLLLMISGAGNPEVGSQFTLTAIAAAFLGAAAFKVGRLNVAGSVVAIIFLSVNITGLTFAGAAAWVNEMVTGVALIVGVGFATVLHRQRRRQATAAAKHVQSPQATPDRAPLPAR